MEDVKRAGQGWIGLEELPGEALGAVPEAEHVEATPHGPRGAASQASQIDGEEQYGSGPLRSTGHFQQGYQRKSHKDDASQGDLALQIQSFGAFESHRGGRFNQV